jgi:hypothetical protein
VRPTFVIVRPPTSISVLLGADNSRGRGAGERHPVARSRDRDAASAKNRVAQLLALWQQGNFPVDRLIETFPFTAIDEAQEASLIGEVLKLVLLPSA